MEQEPLLTVRQAAQRLHVHTDTVRRWIDSGKLEHERVGPYERIKIPESAIEKQRRRSHE